jgi:hypothetical protein
LQGGEILPAWAGGHDAPFVQHEFSVGESAGHVHVQALPSLAPTSGPTQRWVPRHGNTDTAEHPTLVVDSPPSAAHEFIISYHKHLLRMDHAYGGGMQNRGLRGHAMHTIQDLLKRVEGLPESECEACCMWGTLPVAEQKTHGYGDICTGIFRAVDFDPCGLVQEFQCVPTCQPHAALQLAQHMCACMKDSCKSNVLHVHLPPVHNEDTVVHIAHHSDLQAVLQAASTNSTFFSPKYDPVEP